MNLRRLRVDVQFVWDSIPSENIDRRVKECIYLYLRKVTGKNKQSVFKFSILQNFTFILRLFRWQI